MYFYEVLILSVTHHHKRWQSRVSWLFCFAAIFFFCLLQDNLFVGKIIFGNAAHEVLVSSYVDENGSLSDSFGFNPSAAARVSSRHEGFGSHPMSYQDLDESHRAVQLVSPNSLHTGFVLHEENLKYLEAIKSPVAVIAAVGSIHTGKSFLLNQLLGRTSGFQLGYTVETGTSGIWMWTEPIKHKIDSTQASFYDDSAVVDEVSVILLDTEGFHGPDVTKSYDQTLFAIATLLSSEVIFSSVKMMDSRDLEYLEELTKDANLFALRAHAKNLDAAMSSRGCFNKVSTGESVGTQDGENEAANVGEGTDNLGHQDSSLEASAECDSERTLSAAIMNSLSPACLTWVVQDFIQDLEGKTPQQWLDSLIDTTRRDTPIEKIESKPGSLGFPAYDDNTAPSSSSAKGYPYSHSLRELFDYIDCVTLPAPTYSSKLLRLDSLSIYELFEGYKSDIDLFRRRILERALRFPKRKDSFKKRDDELSGRVKVDPQLALSESGVSAYLSGADLADLLRFLVNAANQNFFRDIDIFMDQILQVRADITKNDLTTLYRSAMTMYLGTKTPRLLFETRDYGERLRRHINALWNSQFTNNLEKEPARTSKQTLDKNISDATDEFYKRTDEIIQVHCSQLARKFEIYDEVKIAEKRAVLPHSRASLEQWIISEFSRSSYELEGAINIDKRPYSTTPMCQDEIARYKLRLQTYFDDLRKDNEVAITLRYDKAVKSATDKLFNAVHNPDNLLSYQTDSKFFEETLFTWKMFAIHHYSQNVGDNMKLEYDYNEWEQRLHEALKVPEGIAEEIWRRKCSEQCNDIIERRVHFMKDDISSKLVFPIDEETFNAVTKQFISSSMDELKELYCVNSTTWLIKAKELDSKLLDALKFLEAENIEAIKLHCKAPLDELRKNLDAVAPGYYFWTSFSELAKGQALHTLRKTIYDEEGRSLDISSRLIAKVTNHWIENDLFARFNPQITRNFNAMAFRISGTLLSGLGFIITFFFRRGLIGIISISLGFYLNFGMKVFLGYLRLLFQYAVKYSFSWVAGMFGFEAACVIVFLTIATVTLFIFFYYMQPRGLSAQESDIPVKPLNMNFGDIPESTRSSTPGGYMMEQPMFY